MNASLLGAATLTLLMASTDRPGYELEWSAPPSCPDGSAVTAEIDRLLADVDLPLEPIVIARGVVVQRDGQHYLDLAVHRQGEGGRREQSAGSCEELVEAAGLIVAMAIDPSAAQRATRRPDDPQPEHSDVPPVAEPPEPEPPVEADVGIEPEVLEPQPEEDRPHADPVLEPADVVAEDDEGIEINVGGFVRLGGGVGVGVLPTVGGNVQASVGLRWPRWSLGLTGRYWAPRRGEAEGLSSAAGRFQLWSVGVEGGPVLGGVQWEVPIWAGVSGGAMHGRGEDLPVVSSAASLWMAAHGGVALWWVPRTWVAVGPLIEASVGWTRPTFQTERGRLIHEAGLLAGHFGAAVEFRWAQP